MYFCFTKNYFQKYTRAFFEVIITKRIRKGNGVGFYHFYAGSRSHQKVKSSCSPLKLSLSYTVLHEFRGVITIFGGHAASPSPLLFVIEASKSCPARPVLAQVCVRTFRHGDERVVAATKRRKNYSVPRGYRRAKPSTGGFKAARPRQSPSRLPASPPHVLAATVNPVSSGPSGSHRRPETWVQFTGCSEARRSKKRTHLTYTHVISGVFSVFVKGVSSCNSDKKSEFIVIKRSERAFLVGAVTVTAQTIYR